MTQTFDVHIRADKTGPTPEPGQPWPCAGVEIVADELPEQITLPASFVKRYMSAPWFEAVGFGWLERPSRPDPEETDGTLVVAAEHRSPDGPPPHTFMHAERFIFDTLNHGRVEYRVIAQPDKYLDRGKGKDKPTARVTRKDYAAGNTRVDHFYTCVLEG